MAIALRPVLPTDEPLLLAVFASSRQEEMALVPWDEAQKQAFLQMQLSAQQRHYESHYPHAEHLIIMQGTEGVGRLYVDRGPERIHILDITLIPAHRGGGIGTTLLRDLLTEGEASQRPITIYLDSWSPAKGLFERLDFVPIADQGSHHLLEWRPGRSRTLFERGL